MSRLIDDAERRRRARNGYDEDDVPRPRRPVRPIPQHGGWYEPPRPTLHWSIVAMLGILAILALASVLPRPAALQVPAWPTAVPPALIAPSAAPVPTPEPTAALDYLVPVEDAP